ncbi:pentatricopeptide repeat-containing protein At2g33680-like [Selaginella moellendorffii]|uniref:pentatricopeptide repeat-containing protein At2g33680-like n=1 Tax=Selaginella moellendorffii TaxID=88036 RepID=UPI000D1C5C7D|nr:pentatricopeptide repeat-containing protein At2g33680-like [Selaginella moellendorffii]|eukprot:XP_024517735.1 pentatricopeptide repeat-containing protein At2g33680-like [Selaginella moellendorffii]
MRCHIHRKSRWRDLMGTLVRLYREEEEEASLEVLMAAIKACSSGSIRELNAGKRIHSDVLGGSDGCCSSVFVANSLINLYAKCGGLVDAMAVFEAMPERTIVSWNALVLAFALNSHETLALESISRIRQEGLKPNARTFVAGLKACASLSSTGLKKERGDEEEQEEARHGRKAVMIKFLEKGMVFHSQALAAGLLLDIYVGNALIDMYSKCGSLRDARKVFDTMPARDVVSWTSLICGYAENREEELALGLFSTMELDACAPNARTYVAALVACTSLAEKEKKVDRRVAVLQRGMAIHSRALDDGCVSDMFLASSLVNLYIKCGDLAEARKVFDRMLQRDVVTWTCLILGYAENGFGELALGLFQQMMECQQCQPNARTYVAALVACSSLAAKEIGQQIDGKLVKVESLRKGMALHLEILKRSYESETFVANTLVDMYSKCGSLMDARRVFDRMLDHDAVSWSTLILGYAGNDQDETAIELFEQMRFEGCVPSARTFSSVLVAASNLAVSTQSNATRACCLELGTRIHALAAQSHCDSDTFVANTLIDLYVKCGSLESARAVFDRMLDGRDAVSWNTMILGYADNGQDQLALELFSSMIQRQHCEPTARTFVAALQACAGLAVREESQRSGDGSQLVKARCLEKVIKIHSQALVSESWDVFVESALINAYGKSGSVLDARKVFDMMEFHDVVSWTALILSYVENGESVLGLEIFSWMKHNSMVAPNARTFAAALMAGGNLACLGTGRSIHAEICRGAIETDLLVASCLVDLYGKCGSSGNAERVFESIETGSDPVIWSALVSVHSVQGNTTRALEVFHAMLREGVHANGVTFLSLLAACSRAGMVDAGKRWFRAMIQVYGVVPGIEHHHCLVDMLGRANRLEEALRLVETMPYDPSVVTWTTLLAACEKWNNVVIGRIAYAALLKLDVTQTSTYSLMAKLEASAS